MSKATVNCPKCDAHMEVSARGSESYICYCVGKAGWDGCVAEFGDTKKLAEQEVIRLHSGAKVSQKEMSRATYDAVVAKISAMQDPSKASDMKRQLEQYKIIEQES